MVTLKNQIGHWKGSNKGLYWESFSEKFLHKLFRLHAKSPLFFGLRTRLVKINNQLFWIPKNVGPSFQYLIPTINQFNKINFWNVAKVFFYLNILEQFGNVFFFVSGAFQEFF